MLFLGFLGRYAMYKRFDIQQLTAIKNNFLQRVKTAMKNERAPLFKQFLTAIFKE
jgi:hypothetical protein